MGAFQPVTYSKKELKGLSAAKRKTLKKAIVRHLETHHQIRKIVRQKTRTLYNRLRSK
jgi:hypothetical protein